MIDDDSTLHTSSLDVLSHSFRISLAPDVNNDAANGKTSVGKVTVFLGVHLSAR